MAGEVERVVRVEARLLVGAVRRVLVVRAGAGAGADVWTGALVVEGRRVEAVGGDRVRWEGRVVSGPRE